MKQSNMPKKYLFMCGTPRSGTSYLATVVGSHPLIVMGVERFKHHYAGRSLVPDMFDKERFFDLRPEDSGLPERIAFPNRDEMVEKFDSAWFVGDKYPNMVRHLPVIHAAFPHPTFLFVLRNPVHVARSWRVRASNPKDRWPEKNSFDAGFDYWLDSLRRATKASTLGCSVVVMDYDLLVSGDEGDAVQHLSSIFQTIGAPAAQDSISMLLRTRNGGSKHAVDNYSEAELEKLDAVIESQSWKNFIKAYAADQIALPFWSKVVGRP